MDDPDELCSSSLQGFSTPAPFLTYEFWNFFDEDQRTLLLQEINGHDELLGSRLSRASAPPTYYPFEC
jgi:hypothetical protein